MLRLRKGHELLAPHRLKFALRLESGQAETQCEHVPDVAPEIALVRPSCVHDLHAVPSRIALWFAVALLRRVYLSPNGLNCLVPFPILSGYQELVPIPRNPRNYASTLVESRTIVH